jgi:O-antigen/teichoic acid export membrane protein
VFGRFGEASLIILLLGGLFSLAIIPSCFHFVKALFYNYHAQNIKMIHQIKELLIYGFPRIPAGFAFDGLFTVAPFFASRFASMRDAGYLVIAQSLLRIIQGSMVAFTLVALPEVAYLHKGGETEFLQQRSADIAALAFHIGMFLTFHIILWSDRIVMLWFGSDYMPAVLFMRIFSIAVIPHLVYIMFRSVIDAVDHKPINTLNLSIALAIALVMSFIFVKMGLGVIGFAIAVVLGFMTLGSLSVLHIWKVYRIKRKCLVAGKILVLNAVLIAIAFFFKEYCFEKIFYGIAFVMMAFILEGILFGLYYLSLRKLNVRWTVELERRIVKRTMNA